MKKIFSLLLALTISTCCFADELIVSPKHPQGWTFGISSTKTTSNWFLGFLSGFPQLGGGSLWLYSGNADGSVYADFHGLKDVQLGSITRLGYSTYTSNVAAGRDDINMAPEFKIYLNVPDTQAGSIVLIHPPGLFGAVARGRWTLRNILSEKWICNKLDSSDKRTLNQWLELFPNATVNKLQITAGATTAPRIFAGWTLGVDNVIVGAGLTQPTTYNFEPDPPGSGEKPAPVSRMTSPSSFLIINPVIINLPTYYVADGLPVDTTQSSDEPVEQPDKSKLPKETETIAPTKNPYRIEDDIFVPLLFKGNTALKQILSQLNAVGNPDETLPGQEVKISEGGAFVFGGVPFYIPKTNENAWDSNVFLDDNEHKLIVKVNLHGVTQIHTMMNLTYATGDESTVFVEFRGTNGAFYRTELRVNKEIRDMRTSNFSKIVSPTKVVWSRPLNSRPNQDKNWEMFLDSQMFSLPADFSEQGLQSITFVDKGKHNKQRSFLVGVTAKVKATK